jgi:hypothetical protein
MVINRSLKAQSWGLEDQPNFPIVFQENGELSKRYETIASPFAFLIDEQGIIISKGIVNKGAYVRYVLERSDEKRENPARERLRSNETECERPFSIPAKGGELC